MGTSSTSESEQSSCSKVTEPKARLRRTASTISSFNDSELQQLAPFMGLSGSEKSDGLSSSDSEYESKAVKVETSKNKKKTSMKKQDEMKKRIQKKQAVKKEAMKIAPEEIKEEIKEISTTSSNKSPKTSKSKKSLDNVLSDLISAQENDLTLRKFFEAEQELDNKPTKNTAKQKSKTSQPVKKSRKPSKPQKLEAPPEKAPEKEKDDRDRRKSIDDENNWVPSDETIIDKNSSAGENYLIGESDESWNSVTCFCGAPFAGRPMIECDNCSLWVHMTCGKVRKNYVPAKYVCPLCKPLKRSSSIRKRR